MALQIPEPGPYKPAVKEWRQYQNDVVAKKEGVKDARDIGTARANQTRLNAFGELPKDDKEDFWKFKVANSGAVRLGLIVAKDPEAAKDPQVRVQVMDKRGNILADNEPKSRQYEKFEKFNSDKGGTLPAGDYYVKVTRMPDDERNAKRSYALQVQIGTGFRNDYETVEKPPVVEKPSDIAAKAQPNASTLMAQNLGSMLTDGMNALSGFLDKILNRNSGPSLF